MERFSDEEVATIRKFLQWLVDGNWLSGRYSAGEGVTGADEDGIIVTGFQAVSDYDGYALEKDETFIPWIALTDPEEYGRQQEAEERARKLEEDARQRAYLKQREIEERAALQALKAKYEPPAPSK